MAANSLQYDVVIVGGGMVGAALACALGDTALRVALLEATPPQTEWPESEFDLRVSAITRATQRMLEALQVWPGIVARRVSPFREMHVWDASGDGVIHFDSAELGEAYLGHIIENRVIVAALYERLAQLDTVDLRCPAQLDTLELGAEHVRIVQQDGAEMRAALVVGADGSRSRVRSAADIAVRGWDYDQHALVTYVQTERSHQDTAWQRFMPDGPLAFLPLTDGYSSIVWSTSPAHAEQLKVLDEAAFAEELETAIGSTLGRITSVGPRATFPLRFFDSDAYVRSRLALVGDAAHTIHPLAGQGVNLGMSDAASLAEVLGEAQAARRDLGGMKTLRRYERWRKSDNLAMLVAVDGFKRLFGSEFAPVRWVRNVGLNLTDHLPPAKHLIMQQAMGMQGDLPRLSQP